MTKENKENQILLFTTPSCGGCKIIKPTVLAKGLPIEIVDATEQVDRKEKHGVMSVPTFTVEDAEGNHVETLASGTPESLKFVNEFEIE